MSGPKGPNKSQRKAIETTEGPVLIKAGPGTGKTYTLIERTLNLIKKGVEPNKILLTTFTEKAANELITRLATELSAEGKPFNAKEMYIGTFHSICGRILRDNIELNKRLKGNFKVLDEFGQRHLIFRMMGYLKSTFPGTEKIITRVHEAVSTEHKWADAEDIRKFINTIEEEMVDVEKMKDSDDPDFVEAAEVVEEYRRILREGNMLDFSGLQTECYRFLKETPGILEKLGIKYLMIDEYQDTNYVQEQLVLLLGGEDQNICVVGDDDQSLYRFRGATVSNILEFEKNFEDGKCTSITLEENYRSNDAIVDFYNKWMEDTDERRGFGFSWEGCRHLKTIIPLKEKGKKEKAKAVMKVFGEKEEDWHKNVKDLLKGLKKSGAIKDYNQVAFLFDSVRSTTVRALADYLEGGETEEDRIQVYSPRSNMFFERDEVMLAIGCLLSIFPEGKKYRQMQDGADALHVYYRSCLEKVTDGELVKFLRALEKEAGNCGYLDILYRLFGQEPFRSMMGTDISASATMLRPARNMALLTGQMERFESLYGGGKASPENTKKLFEEYLRLIFKGGIREYEDKEEYAPEGCVSFMTIHQAKGMEFPIVFVGSLEATLNKDSKPSNSSKRKLLAAVEKEYLTDRGKRNEPYRMIKFFDLWRRYYTAFSRAKDLLVLTGHMQVVKGKQAPSKLFKGVCDPLPEKQEGKIEFSGTSKPDLKKTFSFTSHIALYNRCPRLYKLKKELGFKSLRQGNTKETIRGTLVHDTIESIHRAAIDKEEGKITAENIGKWFDANHAALRSSDEYVELSEKDLDSALRQVMNYARGMEGKWNTVKRAEAEIMLPEGNYIIEGRIDLVQGVGDTVEIVDFKTSEKKPKEGSTDYEKNKEQLQVYAHLVEKYYGETVSRMRLHYTAEDKDPLITFDYNREDVSGTIEAFKETAEKILAKDFSGTARDPRFCRKCDFRFYCGK